MGSIHSWLQIGCVMVIGLSQMHCANGSVSSDLVESIGIDQTSENVDPDLLPNELRWITAPPVLNNSTSTQFQFIGAGTLDFRCARDGAETPSTCMSPLQLVDLTDGSHQLNVSLIDDEDVVLNSISHSWTDDGTAPEVTINTQPAAVTGITSASITFSASDALSGAASSTCAFDQQPKAPGESPVKLSGLSDGAHSLTIDAIDRARNRSNPAQIQWAVDLTLPVLMLSTANQPDLIKNEPQAQFVFNSSDVTLDRFECQLDQGGFQTCISPTNLNDLAEGPHTIQVRAVNLAAIVTAGYLFFSHG